jgi:murein DD-endopeptidase MepM/ murein hydrolase activator NlpD
MINLRLPLKQIRVTQPFGVNFLNWYQQWGLNGHNGSDFGAPIGTPCYACHDGKVTFAGVDGDGGVSVTLSNDEQRFKTIYYHLDKVSCKIGDVVKAGDEIGLTGNTGKYTTGPHLHLGLKEMMPDNFNTLNYNNGYKGAIDAGPYFTATYNGFVISPKDYDKSRCYHRYYRVAKRNLANEMKTALYMARRLGRLPNNEEINACIWGGWDIETVLNPAMHTIWSQLKKDEYLKGERPYNVSIG